MTTSEVSPYAPIYHGVLLSVTVQAQDVTVHMTQKQKEVPNNAWLEPAKQASQDRSLMI